MSEGELINFGWLLWEFSMDAAELRASIERISEGRCL